MPPEPTITLTEEQIAFYHENGFLAMTAITTPEEVARLRGVYDRLFEQRAGRAEGNQFDLAGVGRGGQTRRPAADTRPAQVRAGTGRNAVRGERPRHRRSSC